MVFIDIKIYIDTIEFEILKKSDEKIIKINKDNIIIPKSFSSGEQLKYIRKILASIIKQYSVKNAFLNIDENLDVDIINIVKIEGVIEELLASYGVSKWK